MCYVTKRICGIVRQEAHKMCRTNPKHLFDDLYANALIHIYEYGKSGQLNAYYGEISRNSMVSTLENEKLRGGVLNTHGGDRKSREFINTIKPILEQLSPDREEKSLRFGKKKPVVGDPDRSGFNPSGNDKNMDNWLKGA